MESGGVRLVYECECFAAAAAAAAVRLTGVSESVFVTGASALIQEVVYVRSSRARVPNPRSPPT